MEIRTAIIVTDIPFVTQEDKFLALKICKILGKPFPTKSYDYKKILFEFVEKDCRIVNIEEENNKLYINGDINILENPKNHIFKTHHTRINYKEFLRDNKVSTIDYLTRSKK